MNCHGSLRPARASLGPSSAGAGDRSTPGKFSSTGSSRSHVRLGRLAPSFRAFGIRPENWLCAEQLKLVAILSDVTASAAGRGPLQFFFCMRLLKCKGSFRSVNWQAHSHWRANGKSWPSQSLNSGDLLREGMGCFADHIRILIELRQTASAKCADL